MKREESAEVQVTAIHHVKGTGFDGQQVQHVDVAQLAVADVNKGRNRTAQVQQRMHLHCRLGRAKRRPVEQTQTQVDGGRIQRVDRRVQRKPRGFFGIQVAGAHDQTHRQCMINAPVAQVQCVRERGAGGYAAQAHMKQFRRLGSQARFDVAQRLAPGQLRRCKHLRLAKHIGTVQGKVRTPASPLCRSTMRPKVFHGTYSMTCANSVLPTFIRHSRIIKSERIANADSEIQIVDTHESFKTLFHTDFFARSIQINRTLVKSDRLLLKQVSIYVRRVRAAASEMPPGARAASRRSC